MWQIETRKVAQEQAFSSAAIYRTLPLDVFQPLPAKSTQQKTNGDSQNENYH
jgi:hypothetical protein